MDFRFFESLSRSEAEQYLANYLEEEARGVVELLSTAAGDGLRSDFSTKSVPALFAWVSEHLEMRPKGPDESLPAWIRDTESYTQGLFEFAPASRILVLRASYYLGQSFVTTFPDLSWAIGEPTGAEKNQPVVRGFSGGLELAPILVTENLLRRVNLRGSPQTLFGEVVSRWEALVA